MGKPDLSTFPSCHELNLADNKMFSLQILSIFLRILSEFKKTVLQKGGRDVLISVHPETPDILCAVLLAMMPHDWEGRVLNAKS